MPGRLEGRRILLTGVSRGVGRAIADVVLAEGAELLGVARDADRLVQVTRELQAAAGDRFTALAVDVADPAAPEKLRAAVEERWGALDVLFNNAGVQLSKQPALAEEPREQMERQLAINLLGPVYLAHALLPLLRAGNEPRIIHTSSGAGTWAALGESGIGGYRLSKWALNGATLIQAAQLKGEVSVVAFDPGWIRTDLGGPDAPGTVDEAAAGALALLLEPWDTTGVFHKDGQEIPF